MPSISEMGYVMILDIRKVLRSEGASGELAEARRPCDDLAHLIRSDFVAAEPEKFTRDALNLAHAQTKAISLVRAPSGRRPSAADAAFEAAIALPRPEFVDQA